MQGCGQSEAPFPGPEGAGPGETEAAGEALAHRTSSLATASLMPSITPALERQLQVPLTLLYLYSCLHLCLQCLLCLLYLCLAHSLGAHAGGSMGTGGLVQSNVNCLQDTNQRCLPITCMVGLCCSEAGCATTQPAATD